MPRDNGSPSIEEFFSVINDPERLASLKRLNIVYSPGEERFDRITRMARSIFDIPIALISLVTMGNLLWFKSKQGLTDPGLPENRMMSMCGRCIFGDDPFVIEDTLLDPEFKENAIVIREPFIRFYAGIPLRTDTGMKLGTLCLLDQNPRKFSSKDEDMLRDLASWVENEIKMSVLMDSQQELIQKFDELQRKALIDPLTQVWNRNAMDEVLKREISRAERNQSNVALMLIDVDHFKEVNDSYGHRAGDMVLQEVAQRIRMSLRPHDILIRFGGDEFLVFLSDCNQEIVSDIAERTRIRVNNDPIEVQGKLISATLSIGIDFRDRIHKDMIELLISEADSALYQAKENGRNCYVISTKKYDE